MFLAKALIPLVANDTVRRVRLLVADYR